MLLSLFIYSLSYIVFMGKGNPNPIIHLNPNIKTIPRTGPTSEIGKFRTSLNAVRGNKSNKYNSISTKMRKLYEFFKQYNTEEINHLMQFKKLIQIFEEISFPAMVERMEKGQVPNKREMDMLRLLKESYVDVHKLEFGDKKVIEHQVSVHDLRKQMFSDKVIIDAEVLRNESIRQDLDRSGRGESSKSETEERENKRNNESA